MLFLVVRVPHQAVDILPQTLLAHEVGLLDQVTIAVILGSDHAERRELLVVTELVVIAIAMAIVQRGRGCPLIVDFPSQ